VANRHVRAVTQRRRSLSPAVVASPQRTGVLQRLVADGVGWPRWSLYTQQSAPELEG
jgi:hypothetical protein